MKTKLSISLLLVLSSLLQIGCGALLGPNCPEADYSGVVAESGVRVEDNITSRTSPSLDTCHYFDDQVKIISPDGAVYEYSMYYSQFTDADTDAILDLFPDLIFDISKSVYITATTNTESTDFGDTKTLSLNVVDKDTSENLATKKIKLTRD